MDNGEILKTSSFSIVGKEQNLRIISMMEDSNKLSFKYPWKNLESTINRLGEQYIQLIGYGSLLNKDSAANTLSSITKTPILSFGIRRLFNYRIPDNTSRYGGIKDNIKRAALNVTVTENPQDIINAVLINVPIKDIEPLRSREIAYNLIQIPCLLWGKTNQVPFYAYVLYCPNVSFKGVQMTDQGILPDTTYTKVCIEGAKEYGEEFFNYWLETTFLADNKTSFKSWYYKTSNSIKDII